MTNEEILKKAIEKAEKNGYEIQNKGFAVAVIKCDNKKVTYNLFDIIFSHEFAKSFWGNKKVSDFKDCKNDEEFENYMESSMEQSMYNFGDEFYTEDEQGSHMIETRWKYHLMKMVLEEDPIQYLKQFI